MEYCAHPVKNLVKNKWLAIKSSIQMWLSDCLVIDNQLVQLKQSSHLTFSHLKFLCRHIYLIMIMITLINMVVSREKFR